VTKPAQLAWLANLHWAKDPRPLILGFSFECLVFKKTYQGKSIANTKKFFKMKFSLKYAKT